MSTLLALPGEYRKHMVPHLKVSYTFTNTLHNPKRIYKQKASKWALIQVLINH